MRRYERREVPAVKSVEVEARCDRCGVLEADADMAWLCPVVIEVNLGEEGGRRDEYDYCNDCLIEMADALVAAGSKAFLVTGVREGSGGVSPKQYRKKPVVVEAMCWEPNRFPDVGSVVGWLMAAGCDFHHPSGSGATTTLAIRTLEGEMLAQPGDWIIRGVQGEFYPCKPDIFEATYEAVEQS